MGWDLGGVLGGSPNQDITNKMAPVYFMWESTVYGMCIFFGT
jgi:hypothetical protein